MVKLDFCAICGIVYSVYLGDREWREAYQIRSRARSSTYGKHPSQAGQGYPKVWQTGAAVQGLPFIAPGKNRQTFRPAELEDKEGQSQRKNGFS